MTTVDKVIRGWVTAGFGVGAAAVLGVLGAQSAEAAPAPASPPPSSPADIAKQDAEDKRTAADAGNPARKEERAQGRKNAERQNAERKGKSEGKGNSSVADRKHKVPVLDKKSADRFNRVVRQTLPGALPRLPENAGGGGVAVSDQTGDARRTKVGGGVAVSDQLGAGRLAAENVAKKARLADTAARNKASKNAERKVNSSADDLKQDADDKRTAADAGNPARKEARAKGKQAAKKEADRQRQARRGEAAARPARQPDQKKADQKKAEENDPPGGSNALCFGVHLQGAGAGGGGDSCLVFDRRGVGLANSQHVGPGLGFGGQATFSVKGSTANIDELTGRSIYGTVGIAAGPGVELNGSVSEDGKYFNDSVAVGAGIEASASGGLEYTEARRLFDWKDVLP
ncbi:hypothetical protein [Amycolatopsis sp.]|uniref:hypothetical protein n=1 Tax=Amycolatopsis sp. TaxID=37632 RepID=UPI002D7EC5CB|nr:hypothetical protein [Amycolatopsis sp.]HET6706637.1 hypothetical protein [Amycolatopsis sp.]